MDETDDDSNAAVMDKTTLVFCHGQGCVLTNLPIPPMQEFVYWEVKVLQLHEQDQMAVGLATKPYPCWRLPGKEVELLCASMRRIEIPKLSCYY